MKTCAPLPEDLDVYGVTKTWQINALIKANCTHLKFLYDVLALRYGGYSRNGGYTGSIEKIAKDLDTNERTLHTNLQKLRAAGLISYGNRRSSKQGGTIMFINVSAPHENDDKIPFITRAEKPTAEEVESVSEFISSGNSLVTEDVEEVEVEEDPVVEEPVMEMSHEDRLNKAIEEATRAWILYWRTYGEVVDVMKRHLAEGNTISSFVKAWYYIANSDYPKFTEKNFRNALKQSEDYTPTELLDKIAHHDQQLHNLRNAPRREADRMAAEAREVARAATINSGITEKTLAALKAERELALQDILEII